MGFLLLESFFKSILVIFLVLCFIPTANYIELRTLSFAQRRSSSSGFNVWGPISFWADFVKLLFKEERINLTNRRYFHELAPIFSFILSFLPLAVFPICERFFFAGTMIGTEILATTIGLVFVWVSLSFSQWGLMLASWSGTGALSNRGAYRYGGSLLAGEAVFAIIIGTCIFHFGSADIHTISQAQFGFNHLGLPSWGVVEQPIAFIILIALLALRMGRFPFDLVEYQDDNLFGDLSSVKIFLVRLSGLVRNLVASLLVTFLFLGGYSLFPGLNLVVEKLPQSLYFLQFLSLVFKLILILIISSLVKNAYVRVREDKVLSIYWKSLLPLSFINFLATVIINYWDLV